VGWGVGGLVWWWCWREGVVGRFIKGVCLGNRFGMSMWERERERGGGKGLKG